MYRDLNNDYLISEHGNDELRIGFEIKDDRLVKYGKINENKVPWGELIDAWNAKTGDNLNETEEFLDKILIEQSINEFLNNLIPIITSREYSALSKFKVEQLLLLNTCDIIGKKDQYRSRIFNIRYSEGKVVYSSTKEDEVERITQEDIKTDNIGDILQEYEIRIQEDYRMYEYLDEILDANSNTKGIKSWGL